MRYFFHVTNGHDTRDIEGTELATIEEAKLEALKAAGEVITARFGDPWNMTVTDDFDRPRTTTAGLPALKNCSPEILPLSTSSVCPAFVAAIFGAEISASGVRGEIW